MKHASIIPGGLIVLGLTIFGYTNLHAAPGPIASPLVAEANEQTQTFSIEKMTCAACPITVTQAMKKVTGVKIVDIDFTAKTATIVFDPAVTTVDEIAQASTNAGYPAALSGDG